MQHISSTNVASATYMFEKLSVLKYVHTLFGNMSFGNLQFLNLEFEKNHRANKDMHFGHFSKYT
jgi:hypothetical protein